MDERRLQAQEAPVKTKRKSAPARNKPVVVETPDFRSETEEAKWWDEHQDLVADLLLKHGRRSPLATKSVTVRLPVRDIDRARKIAEKRGTGYQTLIKTLLHEALKREAS